MTIQCPNCGTRIDNDLIEEGLCNHCGQEFIPVPFSFSVRATRETYYGSDEDLFFARGRNKVPQ